MYLTCRPSFSQQLAAARPGNRSAKKVDGSIGPKSQKKFISPTNAPCEEHSVEKRHGQLHNGKSTGLDEILLIVVILGIWLYALKCFCNQYSKVCRVSNSSKTTNTTNSKPESSTSAGIKSTQTSELVSDEFAAEPILRGSATPSQIAYFITRDSFGDLRQRRNCCFQTKNRKRNRKDHKGLFGRPTMFPFHSLDQTLESQQLQQRPNSSGSDFCQTNISDPQILLSSQRPMLIRQDSVIELCNTRYLTPAATAQPSSQQLPFYHNPAECFELGGSVYSMPSSVNREFSPQPLEKSTLNQSQKSSLNRRTYIKALTVE